MKEGLRFSTLIWFWISPNLAKYTYRWLPVESGATSQNFPLIFFNFKKLEKKKNTGRILVTNWKNIY